jgi:hypothetical protein
MFEDVFGIPAEPWTNEACLGYTIAALEFLNYTQYEISSAVSELKELFDWMTAAEAGEHYTNSDYCDQVK